MCKKGKIIVIEGPDGTGKQTTTELVHQSLSEEKPNGIIFSTHSFPNYDGFYGKQIKAYLEGDDAAEAVRMPEKNRQDPLLASIPYAEDRYESFRDTLYPKLDSGEWVIFDRYTISNIVFQGAKLNSVAQQDELAHKLDMLEHQVLDIPKPDLIICLSLPEDVRAQRVLNRAKSGNQPTTADIHEEDLDFMEKVRMEYERLTEKYGWTEISCVEDGVELSREAVAKKVTDTIKKNLL